MKLITKNQIKAVYDYCTSQDNFNAKTIDDVFDDTDFKILKIINNVKKEYIRKAEIVEEVYLRINEPIFKNDLTYYMK